MHNSTHLERRFSLEKAGGFERRDRCPPRRAIVPAAKRASKCQKARAPLCYATDEPYLKRGSPLPYRGSPITYWCVCSVKGGTVLSSAPATSAPLPFKTDPIA